MTTVTFEIADGKYHLEVSGHAGAGVEGNDLVCAAISSFVHQWMATLDVYADYISNRDETYQKGFYCSEFECLREHQEQVALLISPILIGFRMTADNYPEYVCFGHKDR